MNQQKMKKATLFFLSVFTICIGQLYGQQKWITDQKSNCKVFILEPAENEKVSWTGGCTDNLASGIGTLIRYDGEKEFARYEGNMLRGVPSGQGIYTYDNGRIFKGNFSESHLMDLDEPYLSKIQKQPVAILDTTEIYVRDGDSKEFYYHNIIPKAPIHGVLVLMPGTQEPTQETISSNKRLIQLAYDNHIAIIVPSVNQRLVMNEEILNLLNDLFSDAINRYQLPKDKFVLGGWSMGGFFSARYAAYSFQDSSKTVIKPIAVFNVDGPTDLENLYKKWNYDISNPRNANKSEPTYAIHELEKYIGGAPEKFHDQYVYYSIYSRSETDGGTAKNLRNIPFRIYNDLDVSWWIRNRGTDLYGMNALDHSAMINFLVGSGNTKAEFINAYGKGYRLDGRRHPHSWSIVDPDECIKWMLLVLNKDQR